MAVARCIKSASYVATWRFQKGEQTVCRSLYFSSACVLTLSWHSNSRFKIKYSKYRTYYAVKCLTRCFQAPWHTTLCTDGESCTHRRCKSLTCRPWSCQRCIDLWSWPLKCAVTPRHRAPSVSIFVHISCVHNTSLMWVGRYDRLHRQLVVKHYKHRERFSGTEPLSLSSGSCWGVHRLVNNPPWTSDDDTVFSEIMMLISWKWSDFFVIITRSRFRRHSVYSGDGMLTGYNSISQGAAAILRPIVMQAFLWY